MDRQLHQVVGGVFGLADLHDLQPTVPPPFLRPRDLLTANARSALQFLLEDLQPPRIWLPAFLCPAILTVTAGKAPHSFYEPGLQLRTVDRRWVRKVQEDELVILVDYFGFRPDPTLIEELVDRGAVVLEDACQALLTASTGENADVVLYSPRKFLGVPDGGILSVRSDLDLGKPRLEPAPDAWWLSAYSACLQRRVFDNGGGPRRWFDLFQQSENESPTGPYSMSKLAHRLLQYAFNYSEIAQTRRENYQALLELIPEFAIFPQLTEGVVPIGFPVRMENRDGVRERLFALDIYPPIHWGVHDLVPGKFLDSCRLAREIMTLPCDQRYNVRTMQKMAELVKQEGRPCKAI